MFDGLGKRNTQPGRRNHEWDSCKAMKSATDTDYGRREGGRSPSPLKQTPCGNEDETTRILAIAERYAAYCRQHSPPDTPDDPGASRNARSLLKGWRFGLSTSPRPRAFAQNWQRRDGGVTN